MRRKNWVAATMVVLSASAPGCRRERGAPLPQEPAASAMRHASEEALEELEEVRRVLEAAGSSPPSLEALERAESSLRKLTRYYVPLLEARECAYRAYRFYFEEPARAEDELERVRSLLDEIALYRAGSVELAIEDAEALLAEARTSLRTGDAYATAKLAALARRLSFMLLKGELIV